MSTRHRVISAVVFAVMWTAIMLWWSYPDKGVAHAVILSVIGVVLGVFWFWISGWRRPSV
jgi:hypothetical protein